MAFGNAAFTTIIAGALVRDPEMRFTPNGKPVTNFTLAIDESYTDQSGARHKRTIFPRLTAWNKAAEIINQYCSKGSGIVCTVKPNWQWEDRTDNQGNAYQVATYRTWTDDQGVVRSDPEYEVIDFKFIGYGGGSGGGQQGGSGNVSASPGSPQGQSQPVDDVPF